MACMPCLSHVMMTQQRHKFAWVAELYVSGPFVDGTSSVSILGTLLGISFLKLVQPGCMPRSFFCL